MAIKIGLIGLGRLGKEIQSLHEVLPIFKHSSRSSLPCDVLIDVSSPHALEENLSAQKPIVIGTTGHQSLEPLKKAAQFLPIFYASNFSLGIALLKKISLYISERFPSDVDLVEVHHTKKKDAPSGTALDLLKIIPQAKVHSIRSAGVVGEHTLTFNTEDEQLTLSHRAHHRKAFAQGALAAAYFMKNKPPGLYGMDNLLEERYHPLL